MRRKVVQMCYARGTFMKFAMQALLYCISLSIIIVVPSNNRFKSNVIVKDKLLFKLHTFYIGPV